ncbi:MAG: methylated-DNA--[Erysipelotrichaceae bacterium]|nr:methylated-DNA--[protein]-cysteine S-methyltransferase [Erysipelotrichaceae bacterium]
MSRYEGYVEFELGCLKLEADEQHLLAVSYCGQKGEERPNAIIRKARKQLKEYFAGQRRKFSLPLLITGTDFQQRIYEALAQVPYGSTVSYRDLTYLAGNRRGFQATGQAVHNNRYMIIIPCHRVINHDGSLGGYGGREDIKRYLLQLEGTVLDQ